MLRAIKLVIAWFYWIFRISGSSIPSSKKRRDLPVTILLYHEVAAQHRDRFARQMDELLKYVIPMSAQQGSRGQIGPYVAITFDDAFQSVFENAVPELVKRNIPFQIFVPSGFLGQHPGWIKKRNATRRLDLVMTESQIRTLPVDLVGIGSHSITHRDLRRLPVEELEIELRESKRRLEEITGRDVNSFAFPYGLYNQTILEACSEAGYKHVFQDLPSKGASKKRLCPTGRINVSPVDWKCEFRLKVLGCYNCLSSLAKIKRVIWATFSMVIDSAS